MASIPVTFEKPNTLVPAPLTGNGTLAVDDGGLELTGQRPANALPIAAGAFVGLVGITVVATIIVACDLEKYLPTKAFLLVGMLFGVAPAFAVYNALEKRLRGAAVTARIPWGRFDVLTGTNVRVLRFGTDEMAGDVVVRSSDPAFPLLYTHLHDRARAVARPLDYRLSLLTRFAETRRFRPLLGGGLLLFVGALFQLIAFTGTGSLGEALGMSLVTALLMLVPGALILRIGMRRVPTLVTTVRERPRDVRWVGLTLQPEPRLRIRMNDGKNLSAPVPLGIEQAVRAEFAAALPWAESNGNGNAAQSAQAMARA